MKKLLLLFFTITSVGFASYETMTVKMEDISTLIEYQGRIEYSDKASLVAREGGYVKSINYKNGELLKRNDIIIELENNQLEIEEEKARIVLDMSRVKYEKYNRLFKKELIAEPELFQYREEYINYKNQYDLIRDRIKKLNIVAIEDGVVGDIDLKVGDYVDTNAKVGTTAPKGSMEVVGYLSSSDVSNIYVGAPMMVSIDGSNIEGSIVEINPFIDDELKKFQVTAEVSSSKYLDNTYGQVSIERDGTKNVVVPSSSIVYYDLNTYVYKVVDNKVKRQRVELGEEVRDKYIIKSGLGVGDVVVTSNLYNVSEGQSIN